MRCGVLRYAMLCCAVRCYAVRCGAMLCCTSSIHPSVCTVSRWQGWWWVWARKGRGDGAREGGRGKGDRREGRNGPGLALFLGKMIQRLPSGGKGRWGWWGDEDDEHEHEGERGGEARQHDWDLTRCAVQSVQSVQSIQSIQSIQSGAPSSVPTGGTVLRLRRRRDCWPCCGMHHRWCMYLRTVHPVRRYGVPVSTYVLYWHLRHPFGTPMNRHVRPKPSKGMCNGDSR